MGKMGNDTIAVFQFEILLESAQTATKHNFQQNKYTLPWVSSAILHFPRAGTKKSV